jgi:nitrite reductase/ring-hydroxylating ferredoxin subunit
MEMTRFVRAARLADVQSSRCVVVQLEGHAVALFAQNGRVYAVDNRCPHMGFPLHRGTVRNGILTCHWHHARFDLATGGTFDPWADDVRSFPVEVRDGHVWVDLALHTDLLAHQRERLRDGLERNIPLVIAKAAITLVEGGEKPAVPFRIGLDFGTTYRRDGWSQGLTIHACLMNLLPSLDPEDRSMALYHGLSAVAANTDMTPPRFPLRPLPDKTADLTAIKRWFRQFVEVRDAEGAERCIASAIDAGADHRVMADMLFSAVTDHRYIDVGHSLDFTNKAFEALDQSGWDRAGLVLSSLVSGYAGADRMEESNAWRHPVDIIAILEHAFQELPRTLGLGRAELISGVLGEDAQAIADALLGALRQGATEDEIAGTVVQAAALRIARFPTSNEFSDWDTALHTFTFANAVQQGLRRAPSVALLRGVFDAAMSIFLDRFLNVPPVRLPEPEGPVGDGGGMLEELTALLDRQQQVNEAGRLAARYLFGGADPDRLIATLSRLLLREDRNFHTIQAVEAAHRQFKDLRGSSVRGDTVIQPVAGGAGLPPDAVHVLVAAARYLAAHAPTVRAQGQTYRIAQRLHRGEKLFEDE